MQFTYLAALPLLSTLATAQTAIYPTGMYPTGVYPTGMPSGGSIPAPMSTVVPPYAMGNGTVPPMPTGASSGIIPPVITPTGATSGLSTVTTGVAGQSSTGTATGASSTSTPTGAMSNDAGSARAGGATFGLAVVAAAAVALL